jgi:NAD(P) transhydrogenase subunit alpha
LPATGPAKPAAAAIAAPKARGHGASEPMAAKSLAMVFGLGALAFLLVGLYAPASFLSHFTVFVLACFVGYMVIWNVTPALHTPLMSVTNAISSVIIVGAILAAGADTGGFGTVLGAVAVALAGINTFGGFLVTQRMLEMFKKKEPRGDAR